MTQVIIQCSPDELAEIQHEYGVAVIDAIPGANLYLLAVPASANSQELAAIGNSFATSQNLKVTIGDVFQETSTPPPANWATVDFYTSSAPDFYVNQPASEKVQLNLAHEYSTGRQSVVALIDTGIDENYPVLRNRLVPGRNYVVPSGDSSEWNDPVIDQSQAEAFDLLRSHASAFDIDQSEVSAFDLLQSQVSVFDLFQDTLRLFFVDEAYGRVAEIGLPPAFGHGTMTAGVVHLVAPDALLMPMKAFDANGNGTLWNVVRAIRDATDMGADVINMSFSGLSDPATVEFIQKVAIDYAKSANIALVAAVGNSSSEVELPPASIEPVVAVAATDSGDRRAWFSNYGIHVDLTGPGVDIITTYPGTFAMASGTSFAAPFVSGLFALMRELGVDGSSSRGEIEGGADSIWQLSPINQKDKLGKGRVNAFDTVKGSKSDKTEKNKSNKSKKSKKSG